LKRKSFFLIFAIALFLRIIFLITYQNGLALQNQVMAEVEAFINWLMLVKQNENFVPVRVGTIMDQLR